MKTRNPVAGNAWKHNRAKVYSPKKGKGSPKKNYDDVIEWDGEDQ